MWVNKPKVVMILVQKRWFQIMLFFIMFFLLVWLISITDFLFIPVARLIGAVALPIIGAGILFYLTKPLMNLFMRFKINRIVSIILVYLTIIIVVSLFIVYIWPIAQQQISNMVDNIPQMVKWAEETFQWFQSNYQTFPDEAVTMVNDFIGNIPQHLETITNNLFGVIGGFIGQVVSAVIGIFLIPFFLFFMLKDGHKLSPFITQIFSKKKAENIKSLMAKMDNVLSSFIQGQLLVSFFVGILLLIGYLIIGLEFALAFALFGMLTNVIPFLGPYLAVIPALIVGGIQDPWNLVWISLIMFVAQQIESALISPNVMGQVLKLHPLTVITVVLAAGSIAGFIGILFAVPFYALVRTIIIHFYQTYRKSKKDEEDALI
ncbi:AI-2E family transporter [Virgibacillus sp. YIM 98842]|jgi:predicted PurR-regulated permease PerM|uniref:AI-2E family transporter n=1 Tax=Virgibacillus sp. YIM 98842 TaxID=2663533 RepID=UPI001F0976A5|nr:AI-2E family transporter [Virgibacillus sp. YIM 98842]